MESDLSAQAFEIIRLLHSEDGLVCLPPGAPHCQSLEELPGSQGGSVEEISLKGNIHNSDLQLDPMTFKVLSSTWGFMILFLLCADAGYVSHCSKRTLRMDRSAVWNVAGALHLFCV